MAEEQRPRILYFKEFIPTSVCILLSLFFAMVFQFNGGVFQGLCVLSFIRTSIATPLGTAILNRWLKYMQQDNIGLISRKMDLVKEWMPDVSIQQLYVTILFSATTILSAVFQPIK